MSRRRALGLGLAVLLAGCAHYPENAKLERYLGAGGYRFEQLDGDNPADPLFVCLSFSGGGTRAAALAYGVLLKLKETSIKAQGLETTLLDEVDCISSVSGGSFTAAYYALFGNRLFEDFYDRFLTRDIQRELVLSALNPVNWIRLASPSFSRIDLVAELYDGTIFDRKTYATLIKERRRPFIIVNATNLANGERFEFTQDQFDFLGSDLGDYAVARAVAASSAFPFLLSPLSLVNRGRPPGFTLPGEYTNALESREANRRRYERARHQSEYLDSQARPFLHLMDGGLADNIGLRAIMSAYQRSDGFIAQRVNGRIKRLVIIVVNARTQSQERLSERRHPPGFLTVAYKTATISMENYSFETVEAMKELLAERERAQRELTACQKKLATRCPDAAPLFGFEQMMRTCVVEINFESLTAPERRRYFLNLPTTFNLPKEDVDKLIRVGSELLDISPEFQLLLRALSGERALGEGIGENGNCS